MSDYHYHYNRDERNALKHQPARESTSGNIFKRNRSLAIVVIDVGILLLIFGIWWAFLRTPTDSTTVQDYRFELTGGVSDNETYAVLTVRNDGDDRSAALFDARFEADAATASDRMVDDRNDGGHDGNRRNADGRVAAEQSEILPLPGDVQVLRVRWEGRYEELRVAVRWGEKSAEIRTSVR